MQSQPSTMAGPEAELLLLGCSSLPSIPAPRTPRLPSLPTSDLPPSPTFLPTVIPQLVTLLSHSHCLTQDPWSLATLDPTLAFSLAPAHCLTLPLSTYRHEVCPGGQIRPHPWAQNKAQPFYLAFRLIVAWLLQPLQPQSPPLHPYRSPSAPALPDHSFPEQFLYFDLSVFFSVVSSFRKTSRTLQSRLGPLLCFCSLEIPCVTSVRSGHWDSVFDVCFPSPPLPLPDTGSSLRARTGPAGLCVPSSLPQRAVRMCGMNLHCYF